MTRKNKQAIKVSATWTPGQTTAATISEGIFGKKSPLGIRGGRLTINAAILTDYADPAHAVRVAARIAELRKELEATGTLHSFTTMAGAVPAGSAERLPEPQEGEAAE